jgi:uncharacterized membrane protein
MEKFIGHRKFVVAMTATLGNILLAWFDKIDPGVYSAVSIAVIGAYLTANVVQHINVKTDKE